MTNNTSVEIQASFTNMELTEGYYLRSLGLYAEDPDAGEILYGVTAEKSGNCYIPAYNGVTSSGIYLQFLTTVGNAENVSLELNPAAIATIKDLQNVEEKLKIIDFDDSGEIEGIESFADFMSSFVKNTSIYQLLSNLKAGLKYVLHAGQLVNSGMCETPGMFPLDAAYGKTLTDQITGLYSDIGYKKLQFGQYVFISYAPGEYEIEIPYPHPFNTMPVIVISLGIPHKNFEGYGMTHLSICNEKNTKNKFVVYLKTEYISDCTYAINWVAMT